MAKLGVLTFHRCINYGSFWQTRCLIDGLRCRGTDPIVLNHSSDRVSRAEWRCALQPLLPVRTSCADSRLYATKIRKFFKAIEALPLSTAFALHDPTGSENCDLVIVGSDEVWNLRHPWYGGCRLFYGDSLAARRVVSYAATFGNHPAANGLDGFWAEGLRKFESISVRDENSKTIVENALGREATLVLDPCLQFPEAIAPYQQVSRKVLPRRYAAVYGHSFPNWFKDSVRRWAQSRAVRLVSIGYRNDWADEQWIDAGPYDFAGFIAGAAAVVTNFFHGCVFSLLNSKPFACVLSDYRWNKIYDLTELLGAERHVISKEAGEQDYEAVLDDAPDAAIGTRLAQHRLRSQAYLDHVLD
ncbi:polysaccharide pyruvyl transferase [Sinorhizobium glycinis]|uniref:Polysaccharide pyruvyl transferase n=1 Tax=Sinorhizobium glycinis TaxID=1472378 RepID=A0A178XN93_9HYPH|nr:polysaccharide pyruvyl transferase family protein [Sinorhizobium glycinis]OAP36664.1 polysaccharide pyruvyl transferase [Sinorhizobium glycinis]